MWSLSKSDSGGESAFGGGGFRRWHGESKCPMEFTMIETFISEGEEWNSLRSDKTFHSCLPCIVHDIIFVFRKNKRKIKVKRLRNGQDR